MIFQFFGMKSIVLENSIVKKHLFYVGFVELGHGHLVSKHIFWVIFDIVGFQESFVFLLE